MDSNRINDILERIFNEESARIVFWNDPDREFLAVLPFLFLEGVSTIRVDQVGALEAKIRIERDEPSTRFLLYSPPEEPDFEDDWLLDIRLYARSFRADRASLVLDELGLTRQHLRQHLFDRRKFCDNKDRLKKLQAFVAADDTEADLDRGAKEGSQREPKRDTGNSPRDLGKMGGAVRKWFSRDLGLSSCRARREHLPEVIAIACSTNNSATECRRLS